jgi:polyisoprenoid-binding protein YceI
MLALLLLALQSAPTLALERYEIDARASTIGFDGTSPLHDFTGKTHAITADLRADRADPGRLVGGVVWIDARTLDTDNHTRDGEMRDLLGVKEFPEIVFHLDSVQGRLDHGRGEFTAQGRFTIKGVEKARVVKFHIDPVPPAKDNSGRDLRVQGEVRFKMTDHGIERPGVLIAKVADEVRVWLDLRLRPVADAGVDALVRAVSVEEDFVPNEPGATPRKRSATEYAWTSGSRLLWERHLDPAWALEDAKGLFSVDPRTGNMQPATGLLESVMKQLSKPGLTGTTWSATVDEAGGRRTLRLSFGDEIAARLPAWALDPRSWCNGPAPAPVH